MKFTAAAVAILAFWTGVFPSPPKASEASAPAALFEKFDDWELFCQPVGGCRISQRLAVEGSGETVFLITVVRSKASGPFVGIVSVPLRGYLAPGIELRVDQRKAYQLLYETCDLAGCHAGFPLEGGVLTDFRAGTMARFRVWTTKDNPVDIDISLIGFTRAFAALGERS